TSHPPRRSTNDILFPLPTEKYTILPRRSLTWDRLHHLRRLRSSLPMSCPLHHRRHARAPLPRRALGAAQRKIPRAEVRRPAVVAEEHHQRVLRHALLVQRPQHAADVVVFGVDHGAIPAPPFIFDRRVLVD